MYFWDFDQIKAKSLETVLGIFPMLITLENLSAIGLWQVAEPSQFYRGDQDEIITYAEVKHKQMIHYSFSAWQIISGQMICHAFLVTSCYRAWVPCWSKPLPQQSFCEKLNWLTKCGIVECLVIWNWPWFEHEHKCLYVSQFTLQQTAGLSRM